MTLPPNLPTEGALNPLMLIVDKAMKEQRDTLAAGRQQDLIRSPPLFNHHSTRCSTTAASGRGRREQQSSHQAVDLPNQTEPQSDRRSGRWDAYSLPWRSEHRTRARSSQTGRQDARCGQQPVRQTSLLARAGSCFPSHGTTALHAAANETSEVKPTFV